MDRLHDLRRQGREERIEIVRQFPTWFVRGHVPSLSAAVAGPDLPK
jgi:hypothetical protein